MLRNYAKIVYRSASKLFSNKSHTIHKHKIHSCNYNDCAKKDKPSGKDVLYSGIIFEYSLASLLRVSQLAE